MAKIICGIYKFTNKYNGKVYIGQSGDINYRYKSYQKPSMIKRCKNTLIMRAFKKYGFNNFDFDILIECTHDKLNYWEKFYIKYYNSNDPKYGYNMTKGGDAFTKGHEPWNKGKTNVYSEETKKSMGADKVGKPSPRKGVNLSDKTKRLISEHGRGRKESEETRKKKSIRCTGSGNPMYGKPCPNSGKHRVYREDGSYYYN